MNMEDFSFGGPGFSGVGDFGRPLNPHDPDFVTGGSSSGSGPRWRGATSISHSAAIKGARSAYPPLGAAASD